MLLLLFALLSSRSSVFQYRQCSSVFSVPVASVFLLLQCSCCFSVPVASVFQYFQRQMEVDLNSHFFSSSRKITWQIFKLRLLQSSPARRGHHDSRCPLGRTLCCGYPWPNTLEVSLGPKAEQDRQEPSNWCLVNIRLQFTTKYLPYPRHYGLSGRGSFTYVQRDVALHPIGQLFWWVPQS